MSFFKATPYIQWKRNKDVASTIARYEEPKKSESEHTSEESSSNSEEEDDGYDKYGCGEYESESDSCQMGIDDTAIIYEDSDINIKDDEPLIMTIKKKEEEIISHCDIIKHKSDKRKSSFNTSTDNDDVDISREHIEGEGNKNSEEISSTKMIAEENPISVKMFMTEREKEDIKYKIFSDVPNILINKVIHEKMIYSRLNRGVIPENESWDIDSFNVWNTFLSLALPKSTHNLSRFIRHCMYACDLFIEQIAFNETSKSGYIRDFETFLFKKKIAPIIKEILEKVKRRRWKCSITKKYQDALCESYCCPSINFTLAPQQHKLHSNNNESEGIESDVDSTPKHEGFIIAFYDNSGNGDPFRKVKKEMNMDDISNKYSHLFVTILWALELRLWAIIDMSSKWLNEQRSPNAFWRLKDTRMLFSVYEPNQLNKPIMTCDIKSIRDAIGRMHCRWNDVKPSQQLYEYFSCMRARCSILSIISKMEDITIDVSNSNKPVDNNTHRSISTSMNNKDYKNTRAEILDPKYAFGDYMGSNKKSIVMSTCKNIFFPLHDKINDIPSTHDDEDDSNGIFNFSFKYGKNALYNQRSDYIKEKKRRILNFKTYLNKKRKLNRKIQRVILKSNTGLDSLNDAKDHKNIKNNIHIAIGDSAKQPLIVRTALNRGSNFLDYSSESSDSGSDLTSSDSSNGEYNIDDMDEHSSIMRKLQRHKRKMDKKDRQKKSKKNTNNSGSSSNIIGVGSIAGSGTGNTDSFFEDKMLSMKGTNYNNTHNGISKDLIMNEILSRRVISLTSSLLSKEREYENIDNTNEDMLENLFFPCLTTEGILQDDTSNSSFHGHIITRTNENFLTETHSMMSEMGEDLHTWNILRSVSTNVTKINEDVCSVSLSCPWIHDSSIFISHKDGRILNTEISMYLMESTIEKTLNRRLENKTMLEKCKIESPLSWAFEFSSGKRHQFLTRKIRELYYSNYLLPGEIEILLNICKLRNSSLVPSIVVSRLRQSDVDRLDKIEYDMTMYSVLSGFAKSNHCDISNGNIFPLRLAKNIYQCTNNVKFIDEEISLITQSDNLFSHRFHSKHKKKNSNVFAGLSKAIQYIRSRSIQYIIHTHSFSNTIVEERKEKLKLKKTHDDIGKKNNVNKEEINVGSYLRFLRCNEETLDELHLEDSSISYFDNALSCPWNCPRGMTRIIRVMFLQCLEFYVKSKHHSLSIKRFFFTSWMSTNLCNQNTFTNFVKVVLSPENTQNILNEDKIPYKKDVYNLINGISENEKSGRIKEKKTARKVSKRRIVKMRNIMIMFRVYMKNRFEMVCQRLYGQWPIITYCMNTAFVLFPKTCTSFECIGADSLFGIHGWLYSCISFISSNVIPLYILHEKILNTKNDDLSKIAIQYDDLIDFERDESDIDNGSGSSETQSNINSTYEKLQKIESIFIHKFSSYTESKYLDKGMYYRVLMELSNKSNRYGEGDTNSKIVGHLCNVIVELTVLMFPHILEIFHIHMTPPDKDNDSKISSLNVTGRTKKVNDSLQNSNDTHLAPKKRHTSISFTCPSNY